MHSAFASQSDHDRLARSARGIENATAGLHRGARERGGVASGGAVAAARPDAAHRCAREPTRCGRSGFLSTLIRVHCVVGFCLFASACAGRIEEGMKRLEGQPLSAEIAKIGPPFERRTISGKTVYMWGTPGPHFPGGSKENGCQIRATMEGEDIVRSRYAATLR
jgi:hypothetical protein